MSDLSPLPLGGRRYKKSRKSAPRRRSRTAAAYLGVGGQEEMDGGRRRRGTRKGRKGSRKSRK